MFFVIKSGEEKKELGRKEDKNNWCNPPQGS